ncbi:hypothetical protein D915_002426 [Fasciola hepatica]|uniref:Uncharacterized protein n=1 Tax=Fasciola hepatica TaxID=6192 RepID=A0A4E0RHQ9_FASHE|nr:hypothetical protein D915_002426 [Fasciola hepatica]
MCHHGNNFFLSVLVISVGMMVTICDVNQTVFQRDSLGNLIDTKVGKIFTSAPISQEKILETLNDLNKTTKENEANLTRLIGIIEKLPK